MAAFTFKGVNYDVIQDGARRLPPRTTGADSESFDGKLRSTVRTSYDGYELKLGPLSIAQLNTLRADAIAGKGTAAGDLLASSFQAFVRVGEAAYDKDENTGIFCVVGVTVRQAE